MPELRFNIDNTFDKTLKDLVSTNDNAKTEADVLQRAVATYKYLRSDLPEGSKIQIVDSAGNVTESDLQVP